MLIGGSICSRDEQENGTYGDVLLLEVFLVEFLERDAANGRVGLVSLEGGVGDE